MPKKLNNISLRPVAPASLLERKAAISDLFFNYEHPHYDTAKKAAEEDEAWIDDPVTRRALLKDALDFAQTFVLATSVELAPVELVEDFLGRL